MLMLFIIESVILCIVFTMIVMIPVYKNPMSMIASYPPKIRARVESLPQYRGCFKQKEKSHIKRKIVSCFIVVFLLALLDWFSGAQTFGTAFVYSFALFFVVNLYDLFVLDIGITCHDKRIRIPGTEDMEQEYRKIGHHVRGAVKGICIGAVVSMLSALIVLIMGFLIK